MFKFRDKKPNEEKFKNESPKKEVEFSQEAMDQIGQFTSKEEIEELYRQEKGEIPPMPEIKGELPEGTYVTETGEIVREGRNR